MGPLHGDSPTSVSGRLADPCGVETELRQALEKLLQLCRELGIVVNLKKSDLEPKTRAKYLGLILDSVALKAFPTDQRIERFMEISQRFLAQESPSAHLWQSLLGHMSSLEKLVPGARLRMRSLQLTLRDQLVSQLQILRFSQSLRRRTV